MSESNSSYLVRSGSVPWNEFGNGDKFHSRHRRLGQAAGGERLGCSLYEVDPGKTAFPFHYHHAIEEAIYVLSGSGTLRLGEERHEMVAGDYVALPTGAHCAHQLINTGSEVLRYLCLSAGGDLDICEYPDSGKVGVFSRGEGKDLRVLWMRESKVGYFDGE